MRQELERNVVTLGRRAENARKLIMHLYEDPVVSVNGVCEILGLKYYTANQLVAALVEMGVLKEITGWQRNRLFVFDKYMRIFDDQNKGR